MKWYSSPYFWRGGAKGAAIAYAIATPVAGVFWTVTGKRGFLWMMLFCPVAVALLVWMYRHWPGTRSDYR